MEDVLQSSPLGETSGCQKQDCRSGKALKRSDNPTASSEWNGQQKTDKRSSPLPSEEGCSREDDLRKKMG